jgi:hypothetical protein
MRLAGFLISAGLIYFIFLKEGQPVDNEYGKADQPKNFIDAMLNR